jgi:hypothetical protein
VEGRLRHASDGRPLAGSVVHVYQTTTGARLEVVTSNGAFRHGDMLDFPGGNPAHFLRR